MLYLARKVGESVIINDTIELTVVEVKGRSAKLGFSFPASATILRKEVHDRVRAENIAASQGEMDQAALDAFAAIGSETPGQKPKE